MTRGIDPLLEAESPDRVHYETGVLLDAADFTAEQSYHRGRLARALRYLHGSGTVAGLRVVHRPAIERDKDVQFPEGREEELEVQPGLALDRLGRIIEVPRRACIRLNRWYESQQPDDVNAALHNDARYKGVVVDLFIRFISCERGKTPAFATGPFDALDALTTSRLRDYYELELVLRKEGNPPLPVTKWPDLAAVKKADRAQTLREAIFNSWPKGTDPNQLDANPNDPEPAVEYVEGQDKSSVFLARIVIPATRTTDEKLPARSAAPVTVDNDARLFVYPPRALASQAE